MDITNYLIEHIQMHPSAQPSDLIKLCYQTAFGTEHLVQDLASAKQLFNEEFSTIASGSSGLYEKISPDYCRVNLFSWKTRGLPKEWLFQMFINSASTPTESDTVFRHHLHQVDLLCEKGLLPFSLENWKQALDSYWIAGGGSVHHSEIYRNAEHPSYRLLNTRFLRLFPLLERLATINSSGQTFIISLDGRSASGKTTMAEQLAQILQGGIIHMDDFFLPPSLRNEIRLAEPGGNVHYERFAQEVLPAISRAQEFSYSRFDCSKMDFGEARKVSSSKWRIVEGAYSCHPIFKNYMDIKVFCDIDPQEQLHRIELRNGAKVAKIFAERWIPMEEAYFKAYQIQQQADMIL